MKAKINPLFQGNNVLQYLDSNKHISKSCELEEIRLDNSVHSPGYYPAKISMYQSTKAVHAIKGHTKGTEIRCPACNRRAITLTKARAGSKQIVCCCFLLALL